MFNKLLDRLETKYGRHAGIRNLMTIVVIGMAITFVGDLMLPVITGKTLSSLLMFSKSMILRGQVWRLFTFIFIPPDSSIIFIVFSLFFYLMLGNSLQSEWGTFRFTVFYLSGMLFNVIAGTITGYATSYYINMSLFLACALLYPNYELNIYGILPIKMKWIALLDLVYLIYSLIISSWPARIALIVSLLNVVLFFVDRAVQQVKDAYRRYQWKKNWRTGNWRK